VQLALKVQQVQLVQSVQLVLQVQQVQLAQQVHKDKA
jgi:hypothetical protein